MWGHSVLEAKPFVGEMPPVPGSSDDLHKEPVIPNLDKPCDFKIGSSRAGVLYVECHTHGTFDFATEKGKCGVALQDQCFAELTKRFDKVLGDKNGEG